MNELQILINKLNEEDGVERFSRRCERENFKQWFQKFQADLPPLSVPEPMIDDDPMVWRAEPCEVDTAQQEMESE